MWKQWILVSALLIGCASYPKRDTASTLNIQIRIEHISKNSWRASYELDQPVEQLVYSGDKTFLLVDSDFEIRHVYGKEIIARKDGAKFLVVEINFNPAMVVPQGAYPSVLSLSDGSVLLNSLYLTAVSEPARQTILTFDLQPLKGENALVNGNPSRQWSPEGDYDFAYFYFGTKQPSRSTSLNVLADPSLPKWIAELLASSGMKIFSFYEREFLQHPKTSIIINVRDLDNRNKNSFGGSAYPGGILINISGSAWKKPSRDFTKRFLSLIAHEGMHRFQGRPTGDFLKRAWLMEGAAEFFANHTLYKFGFLNRTEYLARLSEAANYCVIILGRNRMTLKTPEAGDSFSGTYFCGHVLHYATHTILLSKERGGMFALWRKMFEYAASNNGSLKDDYYFKALIDLNSSSEYLNTATKFISEQHEDPREAIAQLLHSANIKFMQRPPRNRDEVGRQFEFL